MDKIITLSLIFTLLLFENVNGQIDLPNYDTIYSSRKILKNLLSNDFSKSDTIRVGVNHNVKIVRLYNKNGVMKSTISYYNDSTIHLITSNKKFILDGLSLSWYMSGKIKTIGNYFNDYGFEIELYEDGSLMQFHQVYKLSQLGVSSEFYPNGQTFRILYNDSTIYTQKTYHMNGIIAMEGKVLKGKTRIGIWKEYNDKGLLIRVFEYKNQLADEISYLDGDNSIKTGNWLYYDSNGKLIKIETYDEDRLIKTRNLE